MSNINYDSRDLTAESSVRLSSALAPISYVTIGNQAAAESVPMDPIVNEAMEELFGKNIPKESYLVL
ncbi:MAG: hypothetical protein AABX51_01610 [Nanoarchaeota archaeon]